MAPSVAAVPTDTVSHLPLELSANGDKTNGDLASISTLELEDVAKTDYVLRTFRCLIADLCEQFKGGHPGYVSGVFVATSHK
jgi:dihydroxyacetone synthase